MSKFKEGDKLIIKSAKSFHGYKIGTEVEVLKLVKEGYFVSGKGGDNELIIERTRKFMGEEAAKMTKQLIEKIESLTDTPIGESDVPLKQTVTDEDVELAADSSPNDMDDLI